MSKDNGEVEYNEKVNIVLEGLDNGETRESLTEEFGYSHWKSLDTYMRRKGFRYDGENYVPKNSKDDSEEEEDEENERKVNSEITEDSKVVMVQSLFKNGHSDPEDVASKAGFSSHDEMATYMKSRGLAWSVEEKNYVRREGFEEETGSEQKTDTTSTENEVVDRMNNLDRAVVEELLRYLPLLKKLADNEEVLEEIFEKNKDKVPRYAIPGEAETKGLYFSQRMIYVLEEFSDVRNVSQREIIEGALYEFFQKHGFKDEMEAMLGM